MAEDTGEFMEFEILLSTMRRADPVFTGDMNINTGLLIINQCPSNKQYEEQMCFGEKKRMITYNGRGLSKSRNKAIENARGDICLLADDDVIYPDDIEDIVLNAFDRNSDYDILTFQIEGIDRVFKRYSKHECRIGYLRSLKVASVEIAFRTDKIRKSGIRFNELFGTGSKYCSGEENIFLYECLGKGLKIKYIPVKIADMYVGDSTWFKGFDKEYFRAKGAAFSAMSRRFGSILILQFLLRKYTAYGKEMGLFMAAKSMLEGRTEYLRRV